MVNPENIPAYLKKYRGWCNWKFEERRKGLTKVPYNPKSGNHASVNRPDTFADFDSAMKVADSYDGIGIRVGAEIIAIDLDHCKDGDTLQPWAAEIVSHFQDTYIEVSPSGTGLRIILFVAKGYIYDKDTYYIKKGNVEVYVAGATNRFVTITGNVFLKNDIAENMRGLQWLLETHMKRTVPKTQKAQQELHKSYLSDKGVLAKAMASKQGEKFRKLWNGDISDFPSNSEADLGFISILAFYCSGDREQVDRLYRQSALARSKWDEVHGNKTYGEMTIDAALAGMTKFYTPVISAPDNENFNDEMERLVVMNPEDVVKYPWTDIGAGMLFADFYKEALRYVPERKSWFFYEGGIWQQDVGGLKAMKLCMELANLQKLFGYGITGDTRHECMTILYGASTRNGKGTLCESVLKVLGSYGCTARPETIAQKNSTNSSQPSEDIARLAGVRFVNISEPGKGLVLNAAQVKSMTGNDTINARFLHENSFDFQPLFKLYINTNYLPAVNDMTIFTSGRVIIIPFERHFDESEQDKSLKKEFAKPEVQSAILNWLLEGYTLLQKEGLSLPQSVKDATSQYQHDSDKMVLFMEDCMEAGNYEETGG